MKAKKIEICNLKYVNFLKKDVAVREIMSEYTKMIKLLLTSATSCTAERSFSALRRLKTYLRSTMFPILLNSTAVPQIHSDVVTKS